MKKCIKCGFDNYDEAYRCRKCGGKLKNKKNKSLDLDIQNNSLPGQQLPQQQYQGQTYDPYAQQQYQQQYQSNQPNYDTYQGQQFYNTYQGQQFYDTYQGQQYQQYQGQQYQQAQSQNRSYTASGVNDNSYNDNSYASNYQSQPDFNENFNSQGFYDNSYNNYPDNNYNGYNGYNGYNDYNSYDNNSYNNSFDNSYADNYNSFDNNSFDNNSFDNNSSANNQQQAQSNSTQQQQAVNSTGKPQYTYSESHDGNKHTYTVTSSRVITKGNIPADKSSEINQIIEDFKRSAGPMNMDPPPTNAKDFIKREYLKNVNPTEIVHYKPKIAPLVAIVAVLVILTTGLAIGAGLIYSKSENNDTSNESTASTESNVSFKSIPMNSTVYTIDSEEDSSISLELQLPEGFYSVSDISTDYHLAFTNSDKEDAISDENNLGGSVTIADGKLLDTLRSAMASPDNLNDDSTGTFIIETPSGEMQCISLYGSYYGVIKLKDNLYIYISIEDTADGQSPSSESVALAIANSFKKIQK
ncbi:MAG: hypothetical protein UE295_11490 [Acutalibacteraceae bacterium]|nr:hypothetical protein [Acutalibacteraceae bacterium]